VCLLPDTACQLKWQIVYRAIKAIIIIKLPSQARMQKLQNQIKNRVHWVFRSHHLKNTLVTQAIKPTMEAKPLNSTAQALSTAGQSSNTCPPATSKQHHIYASNPCTAWSSTLWCGVAHHRAPCFDIAFQCCNLGCSTAAALMNEWMSHA
jgi:hypothetical protein